MTTAILSTILSLALAAASLHYMPKYGVTVQADKHMDFSKVRKYAWMPSYLQHAPDVDAKIKTSVDRSLAALGLTRLASDEDADVVVTYVSMFRTDADVRARPPASGVSREYRVGTLVVSMLDPRTLKPLLRLRADKVLGEAQITDVIAKTVDEMFAQYPGAPKR